ncbi:NAD(P)-binding protein [Polychaeton citri CBS 116435]|uniref:NAD(P)-binding protein n=1 Tax=Polychaeton citri CBS 116435 TaxID=1314669 RepID=A0A9P4Q652_9PEZI|nr:NAD(P)-binding protein [Polychaeton citri CBS 116435]
MSRYAKAHEKPQGPGDARTTAQQVLDDEDLVGGLVGKTILITGGTAGLGKESARILQKTGAKVFITGRSQAKGAEVAKELNAADPSLTPVEAIALDLGSFESVRNGAAAFLGRSETLTILLENAGVMAPPEGRTVDGFETCFGVNHLSHFLLFHRLLPALKKGSSAEFKSRVVVLSSAAHRMMDYDPENPNFEGEYEPWNAYGHSKSCNVHFAHELDRRYSSEGIHGISVHPGVIFDTELSRHHGGGEELQRNVVEEVPQRAEIVKSIPQGAATQVWASIAKELEGKGGMYVEDVQISQPAKTDDRFNIGYAKWAYDEDKARRLWEDSEKFVGISS